MNNHSIAGSQHIQGIKLCHNIILFSNEFTFLSVEKKNLEQTTYVILLLNNVYLVTIVMDEKKEQNIKSKPNKLSDFFFTHGKKRNSVTVPAAEKASINSSSVVLSLSIQHKENLNPYQLTFL